MFISNEDVIEMSGIEALHPGGLDLSRRIGALVDLGPTVRVLDVSSGKGLFACLYAREFGCQVTGLDINPQFVALARQRAQSEEVADRVEFRIGDSRELPFRDGEFDVVVNECAVGLTVIDDPQRVLDEMVRVTRPGGTVVIHESTWLRELPEAERQDAALRLGTTPYAVSEWEAMLTKARAVPRVVEDWSGIHNLWKMRPDHRWNPHHPADYMTTREKLKLFPRIARQHGIGAVLELYRTRTQATRYLREGYLGYALIVASRN